MSGYTKKAYTKDLENIRRDFTSYIKKIINVLPENYDFDTILSLLKEYYPYEYQILDEKYQYYSKRDKSLISRKGKARFFMPTAEVIIKQLGITKKILSDPYKKDYKLKFNKEEQFKNQELLKKNRLPKINKRREKIEKAKLKAQEVEPVYLDALIGLYSKKRTSQMDRVYIFNELKKYYCTKVINFFKRNVQAEYNRQLREMAFYCLQEWGHYAVLRKQKYMRIHTKNKKRKEYFKNYAYQTFDIKAIPQELEYRIENSKEQRLKNFDFFISHSSSDFKEVQSMIKILNGNCKNVYCDWISDSDYLKRHLVGEATKFVIEKRLEKSDNVLFVRSNKSLQSDWVKYELNYFYSLGKTIFEINIEDIKNGKFEYYLLTDLWFYDENYKDIDLFKVKDINVKKIV